ncbi:glutathione S-transferase [Acetobacter sacchari]|uniref:Glutathione S-transferase n=1 Tax=Acetobacter sacchari TaxID=2661687 RepID=A0ABS3LTE8_9PROT|nr:glutathione S-transferase [Acetobacter sacchari]MBO1359184.1 glutathione S-transferase [Acetobacter sacchari]
MRLVGMLDSPFVRRVAISFELMGLSFDHEAVSVIRTFDAFSQINPVVKAPTLIVDDGTTLMESSLILDYGEALVTEERRLLPVAVPERLRCLHLMGLALAACEKTVQIVYELHLRAETERSRPWLDRVTRQLLAAYAGLNEALTSAGEGWALGERFTQADVTVGVAWRFTQDVAAEYVRAASFPAVARLAARAEQTPAFRAWPPV